MSATIDFQRYAGLTYEHFRRLAQDPSLTAAEKIGFPTSYRAGKEDAIFKDMVSKLAALSERQRLILDIGPGCSDVATRLINHCQSHEHTLLLVDCAEMLELLPNAPRTEKIPARFPDCPDLFARYAGRVNAIISYSVLQVVFEDSNVFDFVDRALQLLAPGGQFLLGDIPNVSKRKRFFSSASGAAFHREFVGRDEVPVVNFNQIEAGKLDDSVVLALVQRCRLSGYDAYILPQAADLPMANRREDVLIIRP